MRTGSAQEIWDAALGELQIQVSKPNYRTWLEKTVGFGYQDDQFIVSVPNTFIAEYLDKNQRSLIEKTLINLTASPEIKVVFQVNGRYKNSPTSGNSEGKSTTAASATAPKFKPNYVFESFIVGDCNRLAYAAAQGVAQNPGQSYNPLFIYGGAGLGKTHLLHAIGQVVVTKNIELICVSAEQFTNEFISSLREKKMDEFHHKYRRIGMLLVDDIHFLSGKEQTEESFFHTFNELHNANRQIVLTSDQPPQALNLLEERLRSRFAWGLVVDLQPPDFQTRLAILQAKARQKGTELTTKVLEFLAHQAQPNIRELEGALNRVIAYARLFHTSPNLELATQALANLTAKKPESTAFTLSQVIEAVTQSFQVALADLKGRKRDKETALARRVAMYLLRQETNSSVTQIGQELGDRDPSAVTNACKQINHDIKTNRYLRRKILEIQKKLNPDLVSRKP